MFDLANTKNNAGRNISKTVANPDFTDTHPINFVVVYTGCLLGLAVLTACYFASAIIMPVCVAFILNLVFRPFVRTLHKIHVPRFAAAMLVILILLGGLAMMGTALSGPISAWGEQLPSALPKLQERMHIFLQPVATIQKTVNQAENVAGIAGGKSANVTVRSPGLSDRLFSSTGVLISCILETLLVLFFLLISGDAFQQRFLEILPRIQDKKKALQISHQIETDIAAYLRTITFMNIFVGAATTLIMYACGVGDAVLWGTIAFLLNYVPILGPAVATCIFIAAGLLTNKELGMAMLPAGLYFAVHLAEGQLITPLILSRRFTLNPALIILMLIFWYWMWGVAGAILATPMLAILKIICDRVENLKRIGHLIEG